VLEISALFAYLGRQLGRVFSTAFSWATTVLFGRVPKDKQLLLSVMAAASLVWPIVLAGVAVPSFATFLLGFVTVPDRFVPYVRPVLLAIALALPLVVGGVASRLPAARERPHGAALLRTILGGYPNAAALFVVLVWMMLVAPAGRIRALTKRWDSAHVALAIEPGGYSIVVRDLERALDLAGIDVRVRRAPWPYEVPGKVLALFGGAGVRALVPTKLAELVRPDLEVVVHPMDLAIQGRKRPLARARAALVRELTFTRAHQTWTAEAQRLEDQLAAAARGQTDLDAVAKRVEIADLDYEEWEILYRLLLQVRLRLSPVETDALDSDAEPVPTLRRRLDGLVAAFRALWPRRAA